MDPLTHALTGAAVAHWPAARPGWRRVAALVFLSFLPDFDFLASLFSHGEAWRLWWHRGLTHSMLGVVVQALLMTALLARFDPGPWPERLARYAAALGLHVLFDGLTNFPVPLWSPWNELGVRAALTPDVGILPVMGAVVALVLWRRGDGRRGWKAFALFWLAYLGGLGLIKAKVKANAAAHIEGRLTVEPNLVTPFVWRVVRPSLDGLSYEWFRAGLAGAPAPAGRIDSAAEGWAPALTTDMGRAAFARTRRPVWRVVPGADGGRTVFLGDVIFSSIGAVQWRLETRIDAAGRVTAQRVRHAVADNPS